MTYLARGHFYIGSKMDLTLSDYYNTYSSTYPIGCPASGCDTYAVAVNGTGVIRNDDECAQRSARGSSIRLKRHRPSAL